MKHCFYLLVILYTTAYGQSGYLTGTVQDRITGEPLSGAMVSIAGTALCSETGADGRYFIHGVPEGDVTASVSCPGYIGMDSEQIYVSRKDTSSIVFALPDDALAIMYDGSFPVPKLDIRSCRYGGRCFFVENGMIKVQWRCSCIPSDGNLITVRGRIRVAMREIQERYDERYGM